MTGTPFFADPPDIVPSPAADRSVPRGRRAIRRTPTLHFALRMPITPFVAAILGAALHASGVDAQGVQRFQCVGQVTGVASQAVIEIAAGGCYTEGPGVAGRISNRYADYTFSGTLFGGSEGYVSMVDLRTGARIDRVWIGVGQAGFALRTEDGALYPFRCRG